MKTVYMMVSKDKYELPVCVCDTVRELAEMVGTSVNTIFSNISAEKHRGIKSKYKKVIIE